MKHTNMADIIMYLDKRDKDDANTAEKRILLLEKEIEQLKKEIEQLKQHQTIPCTPIIVPITIPTDKGPSDCPDSGGWEPWQPWQEWYTICLSRQKGGNDNEIGS